MPERIDNKKKQDDDFIKSSETEHTEKTITIPVIQEELQIGKKEVQTGKVRIRKTINEYEKQFDIPLYEDEVEIKRIPVNKLIDKPISIHQEGETTVFPVIKEVLVTEKKLILIEELHITKKRKEKHEIKNETLKSEEITVERVKT